MKKRRLIFLIFSFIFAFCFFSFASDCHAGQVTIIYSGDTHAMLYPCRCPIERDGGVARRSALIGQLKKKNPHSLVLDSGRFFAGGTMDEYTQSSTLDMARSRVNLKSMEAMGYDAVGISENEFNFGKEFLGEEIKNSRLAFICANINMPKVLPYTIKDVAGIRIGIVGLAPKAASQKAEGVVVSEAKKALAEAIEGLKKEKAAVIILLSSLEENESVRLIREFPQVNILILSRSHTKGDYFNRIGDTLIFKPSWQGRRLGVADLYIEGDKITNYEVNEVRASDRLADDPKITAILPACFSDEDCKKNGLSASCDQPGALKASCIFQKAKEISLSVILPKYCRTCETGKVIGFLKRYFPGLSSPSYLYYPEAKADKIARDLNISGLPAYLLGKEAQKEKGFDGLKESLEDKGDFYLLKAQVSGISYFIGREAALGRLDLFFSLFDKDAAAVLEAAKEFKPNVHFLAIRQQDSFEAKGGRGEVEECMRAVCVKKHYPAHFWNYISCRAANIDSSWWQDCLQDFDQAVIMQCARSREGRDLLAENVGLNEELGIMFGPVFLLDNQEIFSSTGRPQKEELRGIISKRR